VNRAQDARRGILKIDMSDSITQARNIGIYNLHMPARGGGEKLTLVLAEHLSRNHNVQLFHNALIDATMLAETFAVDLGRVRFTQLDRIGLPLRLLARLRGRRAAFSAHYRPLKELNLDLFINISYGSVLPCPAAKGIFLCMFPHLENSTGQDLIRRWRNGLSDSIEQNLTGVKAGMWLDSYSEVIAISQYSADWVERLWGRQAQVVYPPADNMGPPSEKKKMILHVGRFMSAKPETDQHHKAQEFLLAAFSEMKDLHREGWELHFAGNIGSDADAQRFAATMAQKTTGLPVRFHFDVTFSELRELYRQAAIYWHATGAGTDARAHPARHEHFGITTVEAMSAGAVPVVINSGGQREIVTHGIDGFCWNDVSELASYTRMLIEDSELRIRSSHAAVEGSKKFRRDLFNQSMDKLINRLLNPSGVG
jgi:glycosyltransferase involved in cell wall biosynthesis